MAPEVVQDSRLLQLCWFYNTFAWTGIAKQYQLVGVTP